MHEYLSDRYFPYGGCIECKKRTAHFCISCHYCYSYHHKIEKLEKEKDIRVTRLDIIKFYDAHLFSYTRGQG